MADNDGVMGDIDIDDDDDVTSCDAIEVAVLAIALLLTTVDGDVADDEEVATVVEGESAQNEPDRVRRSNSIEFVRARFTRPVAFTSLSNSAVNVDDGAALRNERFIQSQKDDFCSYDDDLSPIERREPRGDDPFYENKTNQINHFKNVCIQELVEHKQYELMQLHHHSIAQYHLQFIVVVVVSINSTTKLLLITGMRAKESTSIATTSTNASDDSVMDVSREDLRDDLSLWRHKQI